MKVGNIDVTNPLELIQIIMAFDSRDWFVNKRDRMIFAIVFGIDTGEMTEEYRNVGYSEDTINEYRLMHERYELLKCQDVTIPSKVSKNIINDMQDTVYKRAFENACKVYAEMAGADVELFKRDMLEDAMEEGNES